MIARAFPLFLFIILLPDLYIYRRWIRPRVHGRWWIPLIWWTLTVAMLVATCLLAMTRDFTPHPQTPLNVYLWVLGVFTLPKLLLMLCDWVGRMLRSLTHGKRNWGIPVGIALGILSAYITIYGSTLGFNIFEVNRVEYASADLPDGFDGYRIALWSDAHVGNYTGSNAQLLKDAVDSLNAMKPDVIFFLGDLQNVGPDEIEECLPTLSQLSAPDGVYSVLGNHDYSKYQGGTREEKLANEARTQDLQRQMGWRLLMNKHTLLYHGGDSITLAGMEGNEEKNQDHGFAIWEKTVEGIDYELFTIMLAHDPLLWGNYIVPYTNAQLTLSGHTHGGQLRILGMSTTIMFPEDDGMYERDGKHLFVTRGLGALIPLRFNVTGEVVLLTLHKQSQ